MVRVLIIAVLVVVAWLLLVRLYRDLAAARVDWNGVAFIVGFVSLAFYLRHVTGLG